MRQLVSISMDGPNVNLKLGDLLQKEHAELYGAQGGKLWASHTPQCSEGRLYHVAAGQASFPFPQWVPVMNADIGLGTVSAIRASLIYSLCSIACMDFYCTPI